MAELHTAKRATRASSAAGAGKPPQQPRTRAMSGGGQLLGMELLAALDEPPRGAITAMAPSPSPSSLRPRSDSTLSSDTFDGIYSLDDVDDVDVDVDGMDLDVIDVDVFRPSALIARKLEDEYGSGSSGGRTSDLERMLLLVDAPMGGVGDVEQHDDDEDDDDDDDAMGVMAHLAQLDQQQQLHSNNNKPLAVDRETSGFRALLPLASGGNKSDIGCVVTTSAHGYDSHMQIAAALPPKYFASGAHSSPHKRRAHKRLFGDHSTPSSFAFRFASPSPRSAAATAAAALSTVPAQRGLSSRRTKAQQPSPVQQAVAVPVASASKPRPQPQPRSLFREVAEDIARRPVDRDDHTTTPTTTRGAPADGDHEKEAAMVKSEPSVDLTPQLQAQLQPQTPVRPPGRAAATTTTTTTTQRHSLTPPEVFHTPVRLTTSQALPSNSSSFQTPAAASGSGRFSFSCSSTAARRAISPATSFDKIAVVHAKDTPGKVDKFEWTIHSSGSCDAGGPGGALVTTATSSSRTRTTSAIRRLESHSPSASPALPAKSRGRSASCEQHEEEEDEHEKQEGQDLPPRYVRDSPSSPHKRRIIHSTTFGAFARSFSFTTL